MKTYLSTNLVVHCEDGKFDHISFHRTWKDGNVYWHEDSIVPKPCDLIMLSLPLHIPSGSNYTKGFSLYGEAVKDNHINIAGYNFIIVGMEAYYLLKVIPEIRFWRIRYIYYSIKRWLEDINIKLLKTAYVWELLDTEELMLMQWKDLKIIKLIRRIYEKTKSWKSC